MSRGLKGPRWPLWPQCLHHPPSLNLWQPLKHSCFKDSSLAEILPEKFFPQKPTWSTPSPPLGLCWTIPFLVKASLMVLFQTASHCPQAFLIPFPCLSLLHGTYYYLTCFILICLCRSLSHYHCLSSKKAGIFVLFTAAPPLPGRVSVWHRTGP